MSAEEQPNDGEPMSERERAIMIMEIIDAIIKGGPRVLWTVKRAMMEHDGGSLAGPDDNAELRRQLNDPASPAEWRRPEGAW